MNIRTWESLLYVLKDDLNLVLNDLPDTEVVGRSGQPADPPTAARVCRTSCSPQLLRAQLKHLDGDYTKKQIQNIRSKYRHLPDRYYEDDAEKVITPAKFGKRVWN